MYPYMFKHIQIESIKIIIIQIRRICIELQRVECIAAYC